jgi:hypothetical protein
MNVSENLFSSYVTFESRQLGWRNSLSNYVMCIIMTNFHVDIGYLINSTDLITSFNIQNELRDFSHATTWLTHFGSISQVYFSYHLLFSIAKNK